MKSYGRDPNPTRKTREHVCAALSPSPSPSLSPTVFRPLLPHSFHLPPSLSLMHTCTHFSLSSMWAPSKKNSHLPTRQEESSHQELNCWAPWSHTSQTLELQENKFELFKPICGILLGFPDSTVVKNPPANAGDIGDKDSIPGSGRSPGEGTDNLLQYSCLENPMDRGTWWPTVHGVTKSQTQLCTHMVSCYGSPQVNQATYPLIVTVSGYFLYNFLFVSLFLHLK